MINLYRREWDDFVVTTVYGSDEAREALLGQVRQVSDWDALLDARFLQRGAYLLPYGEFDWSGHLDSFTPDIPVSDDPNAWHPDDALFVPMRAADGTLLGILSVDEPISGRKPSGDEIDVLVAVTEHAALAVQAAQESSRAKANSEALAHLLAVSARLNESHDTHELLQHVTQAISGGTRLREGRRAAAEPQRGHLRDRRRDRLRAGAEHRRAAERRAGRAAAVERARRGVPAARRRRSLRARARARARLPVAAERPRPARLEQPLALRAPLRPSRPRRLHLGGRPAGPAAPRAGAPAHSARVREPGDDGARAGSTVRADPGGARAPARADRGVAGRDRRLRLRRARALVERRRDGDVRLDAGRGDRPRQPHRPRRRAGPLPRATSSASRRPARCCAISTSVAATATER